MLLIKIMCVVSLVFVVGCSNATEPVNTPKPATETKVLVASNTHKGYAIELYTDDSASVAVGYTPLFIKVKHEGVVLRDVHLNIIPDMNMGTMHHSCPAIQPETTFPNAEGFYQCSVVFTMPSSNAWTLGVTLRDQNQDTLVTVHVPISVSNSDLVGTTQGNTGATYTIALAHSTWTVGMNDVRFLVYETLDGFAFTPVSEATFLVDPRMPSMGHGSRGNENPKHQLDGWFAGRINLTMTGDWEIGLKVQTPTSGMMTTKFPIRLP